MNIFATDTCPVRSARNLDLKRVVKMILESFQLMSNAMWRLQGRGFYRSTHFNHPCSLWAAASRENFRWLLLHAKELMSVYTEHYGKHHTCENYVTECEHFLQNATFPVDALTSFANCTDYKSTETHKAYRFQMLKKWELDKRPPHWPETIDPIALVTGWRRELATAPF